MKLMACEFICLNYDMRLLSSGCSSYRDKGINPTNKFKLILFLFCFQNLISLTL